MTVKRSHSRWKALEEKSSVQATEYTVNTHWNIPSVTVNKSIHSFIHSASSAKLHYSIGSILICYSSFLVFWEKTSLPPLENRLLVLHKYSTCKDYLVTNQFNSNEFDMCSSIYCTRNNESCLIWSTADMYCSYIVCVSNSTKTL